MGCDQGLAPQRDHLSGDFNPRTPCGVRLTLAIDSPRESIFQSTHPVWGATHGRHSPIQLADEFQSTHPVWGATQGPAGPQGPKGISIHAPRVGCDQGNRRQPPGRSDFNPRTPCGVRPTAARTRELSSRDFNPRTPCGVRLAALVLFREHTGISIHAPRVGCDLPLLGHHSSTRRNFNPRTPCGVRPQCTGPRRTACEHFNPRTPCGVRQV